MKPNYRKTPLLPEMVKKARLIGLAGDPTRMRILCFMFKYGSACVCDIAESLGMSLNAISHHLQIMRDNGYLDSERMGNMISYSLVKNDFTKQLEKLFHC